MEKKEWLALFDRTCGTFKWFFLQYGFTKNWEQLILIRETTENYDRMIGIMNYVWFCLPDSKFNIIENPKGWVEFLNLIEV